MRPILWMIPFLAVLAGCAGMTETSQATSSGPAPVAPSSVPEDRWVELGGGLKYAILREGKGEETAGPHQRVTVHYTGWLRDTGVKFDSSHDTATPFGFEIGHGEVIPGWERGVVGMRVGEVRQIVIPPDLGYGERGQHPVIPPNATLVFEVELLSATKGH